jgi:hypothetical protein
MHLEEIREIRRRTAMSRRLMWKGNKCLISQSLMDAYAAVAGPWPCFTILIQILTFLKRREKKALVRFWITICRHACVLCLAVCRQTASGSETAAVFSVRCDGEVLRRFQASKWYYAVFRSDSDAERIQ